MQPLKAVRGSLVRTTIFDKYNNVKVDPAPFCVQGQRSFHTVSMTEKGLEKFYALKIVEHSTEADLFNAEMESLLEGWAINNQLQNPYIVKVTSVRLIKEPGNGRLHSEVLLEECGESIWEYLKKSESPLQDLVSLADQLVQTLIFAQSHGCFHGDLSPDKLFVKDRQLKVLDFGGTMFLAAENDINTRKLLSTWNAAYWPPEKYQLLDRQLSRADRLKMLEQFDVYSWGIVFYQLLTHKSLSDLEKECLLYKKNIEGYKTFNKMIMELGLSVKPEEVYQSYFEPLLRMALEYDPANRASLTKLRDNSAHNRSSVAKKKFQSPQKETMKKMLLEYDEIEEGKETMCYACMKDRGPLIKACLDCNHTVCELCIKDQIKKMLDEKAEKKMQLYCFLCKDWFFIKTLFAKCKCRINIEALKINHKEKILDYSRAKSHFVVGLCPKNHELTEEEGYIVFGPLCAHLDKAKIDNEIAAGLSNALEKLHLLECLDLRHNSIQAAGLGAIVGAISLKQNLTTVLLDWNPLGPTGGSALRELLESTMVLTELTLDTCQLGSKGISELSKGLEMNISLKKLSIEWNQMGIEGAKALGYSLKKNSTLISLRAGYNMIGDTGIISLMQSLQTHPSIQIFKAGNNQISNKGALEISSRLRSNEILQKLALDHNPISDETVILELRKLEMKTPKIALSLEGLFSR